MVNVKIKSIEIYHPENEVGNEFFIDHFKKQEKDITRLLKAFGRDKRYIIDNDKENTLTMGIEASKKALKVAGLEGKDIDMVLFSSQFPEYTVPSQSLILHNAIGGKNDTLCLDTNANCVGMLVTVENTVKALLSNPYAKRALIVGSDYMSIHCKKDDEMTYPNFADCACAIILEKTDEDCGYIDGNCRTNGATWELVNFPACGSSNIYNKNISIDDRNLSWTPFDGTFVLDHAVESIDELLNRNNLKLEDIDTYCFSQYSKAFADIGSQKLGEDINKFIYIGDKYGYTGTSSPFIALYEGIKSGRIKRGDTICLWSVGTHWTICTMLMKY